MQTMATIQGSTNFSLSRCIITHARQAKACGTSNCQTHKKATAPAAASCPSAHLFSTNRRIPPCSLPSMPCSTSLALCPPPCAQSFCPPSRSAHHPVEVQNDCHAYVRRAYGSRYGNFGIRLGIKATFLVFVSPNSFASLAALVGEPAAIFMSTVSC